MEKGRNVGAIIEYVTDPAGPRSKSTAETFPKEVPGKSSSETLNME